MEMRYFYVCDQVRRGHFLVRHYPCQENLANYTSKHHDEAHHIKVRPYYQHERNSPRFLPRALRPRDLRGCVEFGEKAGYKKGSPLPQINEGQIANRSRVKLGDHHVSRKKIQRMTPTMLASKLAKSKSISQSSDLREVAH
jgi:hypothetical protein